MSKEQALANSQDTGLVSLEQAKKQLANVQDIFNVDDTVKGVKGRIPQIKIIHQAQMFAFGEEKSPSFQAIIIHQTPTNAYWEQDFSTSGGGNVPDCFAMDAMNPQVIGEDKKTQAPNCAACKQNVFGSSGRGKACKNMWRLHLILPGQTLPKRLTLPPSNLGDIQDFLVQLRDNNIPSELAVVEFSLKKDKNKDGIEYSKIVCKVKGVITDRAKAMDLKKIKTEFAAAFGQVIDVSEYSNEETEAK